MPASVSRRHCLQLIPALGLLGLSGCSAASLIRSIDLDGDDLQRKLAARFPMQQRLLGMAEITLRHPRLRFHPDTNQIGTRVQVDVPSVFGITPTLSGTVDLRYGLRFEPSDNSVRITDLRVQAIDLRDPAGRSQLRISQAVSLLGEQLFSDYSVYQLSASDLAKARQLRLKPGKVTAKRNGLEIELLPGS